MNNKIILASGNKGKLDEFRRMLAPFGYEVVSMAEAGFTGEIVEDGATFRENALIKARAIHKATGLATVSDDSGLCVDALGGRPGVYSARYLGEKASYPEKIAGLLKELEGVPDEKRTAHFACAIAYITADGTEYVLEGICEGKIGYEPKGERGFGFDPVFYLGGQSFAELSDFEKDEVSHRGRALRLLEAKMMELAGQEN